MFTAISLALYIDIQNDAILYYVAIYFDSRKSLFIMYFYIIKMVLLYIYVGIYYKFSVILFLGLILIKSL